MIETVFGNLVEYFHVVTSPSSRIYPLYLLSSLGLALIAYWQIEKSHAAEHGHEDEGKDRPTFLRYVFDPRIIFHPSTRQDVKFFLVNSLVYYALIAQFLVSVQVFSTIFHSLLVGGFGEVAEPMMSSGTVLIVYTLVAALAIDLGVYIAHYLFHRVPILWEFHKVHHSAEELNPVTLFRMHPVDLFLTALVVSILKGAAFAGMFYLAAKEPTAISILGLNLFFFVFYIVGYNLRHSHIWLNYPMWLSRIFVSPAQHQIHHSSDPKHFDKNFGLMFSIWDQLMGTSYIPRKREKLQFGLSREEPNPFHSIKDIYVKPFIWAAEIFRDTMKVPEARQKALIAGFAIAGLVVTGQMQYRNAVLAKGPDVPSGKLAKLTWTEVDTAIKKGYRTVIVPTAGTEQNGPFVVLGKHHIVVDHTSHAVAHKLGETLVAPVMDYVPEGNAGAKPSGHMRWAGTLTLPETVFESVLEHTARSLKTHGFQEIYFLGDSGGNQKAQKRVAEKLQAEWASDSVRIASVDKYYNANGQFAYLQKAGYTDTEIGQHAGIRDTSEILAISPESVRITKRNILKVDDLGYSGAPKKASAKIGRKMLAMKINAAVAQIKAMRETPIKVVPALDKLADASGG